MASSSSRDEPLAARLELAAGGPTMIFDGECNLCNQAQQFEKPYWEPYGEPYEEPYEEPSEEPYEEPHRQPYEEPYEAPC